MDNLLTDGYLIVEQFIDPRLSINLGRAICDRLETEGSYGVRNIQHKIPLVNQLANSSMSIEYLQKYTNKRQFKLIKAIYFNKNIQHNWFVPWHQDKTIAVTNKVTLDGYINWTIKQGVLHVQPPLKVLSKIATVRIALDDIDANNGGLRIIPRTHSLGVLSKEEIDKIVKQQTPLSLSLKAGDALFMHPLILHSSIRYLSTIRINLFSNRKL